MSTIPLPLKEKNASGRVRTVYFKHRPLTGRFLETLSDGIVEHSHWALEIGDYTHELEVEHSAGKRRARHSRGKWTAPPKFRRAIGETSETDARIDEIGEFNHKLYTFRFIMLRNMRHPAKEVIKAMNLSGDYREIQNNCQQFCGILADVICTPGGNDLRSHKTARGAVADVFRGALYGSIAALLLSIAEAVR